MKNWQGIPTTCLTLGGEVMLPQDNSTLAFSTNSSTTSLLLPLNGKAGTIKHLTVDLVVSCLQCREKFAVKFKNLSQDDSLLIHECICSLFIFCCLVTSNMTGYYHSYHSIKLIYFGAPQGNVLSDKIVF